jgi:hypothetical protein
MTILRSAVKNVGNPVDRDGKNRRSLLRPGAVAKLAGLALILLPLPGCQSITGTPTLSQVRILDASPDAPGIDVYQGSAPLAYNLGLGTITSYVPIVPGGYPIIVDTAGTRQQLVSATGTFLRESQYTVLVGNYAATLQELILKDQSQPAPSGDISIRVVDQSVRAGAVDLYLVPSGSTIATTKPFLTDVTFNTNSGYINLPTGTYTLAALPANTVPTTTVATLYTGAAVAYGGGSAKTIVLIDTTVTTVPGIQVITADDYDPAS